MASLRFKGLQRYQRRMKQAPKKIDRETSAATRELGGKLHADVRKGAPVDKGALRAGIKLRKLKGSGKTKTIEVIGTAPHSAIINYGGRAGVNRSVRIRPTRYFSNAVEKIKVAARKRYGKVFRVV